MNSEDAMCECCPQRKVPYGLPCAKCRTYYSADLTVCPVGNCGERALAACCLADVENLTKPIK